MAVTKDKFKSEYGFESPNFEVQTSGALKAQSIDVNTILLGGTPFVQYTPPEDDDDAVVIPNTFTSLNVNEGIFQVNQNSKNIVKVEEGKIVLHSDVTGEINNMDIGLSTPGQAKFISIDMAQPQDSTTSTINLNNTVFNGDLTVNDNVILTNQPSVANHASTKGYVDSTASALAIAFGV